MQPRCLISGLQRSFWLLLLIIVQLLSGCFASLCLTCTTVGLQQLILSSNASLFSRLNVSFHMPKAAKNCMETPIIRRPDFTGTERTACSSNGCSKLKGYYKDEAFIIRSCWEKLWRQKLDLPPSFEGCTPVPFLFDLSAQVCVCRDDLCNVAPALNTSGLLSLLCLTATFYSLLNLLLFSYYS